MAVICIIEKDQELQADIERYLEEIEVEKKLHFYSDLNQFSIASKIFQAEKVDGKAFDTVDLLFINKNCLENTKEDLIKIREGLKRQELNPEFPCRILLTSDDDHPDSIFGLPIDDYLLLPYEKLLFLQKTEIALNGEENTTPSFLALQPIKEKVEIGKSSKFKGISDFAIEIINPANIQEGAFVHFYSKAFGQDRVGKVLTRSYGSYKEGDAFVSRFDYYGMLPNQLSVVRRNNSKLDQKLVYDIKRKQVQKPEKLNIVIIDADPEANKSLNEMLGAFLDNINILAFPSYTSFLKSCFSSATKEKTQESDDEEDEEELVVKVAIDGANEIHFDMDSEKKTSGWNFNGAVSFLSRNENEWKAAPEDFAATIDERMQDNLEDFLNFSLQGSKGTAKFVCKHPDGELCLIQVSAEKKGSVVSCKVKDLTNIEKDYDYFNLDIDDIKIDRIDMLFIDAAFIKNPKVWIEVMEEKVQSLSYKKMPKIILTSSKHDANYIKKYQHKYFYDFLLKPIDRGMFAKKSLVSYFPFLEETKDGRAKMSEIQMLNNTDVLMLATEVDMLSLSEFGISIRFHAPIRKDMFIHFYLKSFLGMEDHTPILARCYFTEADESEKGKYICYFSFLGVSEEVFKQIRLWMREYYIKNKEKS